MMARISPASTTRLMSLLASRPPKRLVRSLTSSSATTSPQRDQTTRQKHCHEQNGQAENQQIQAQARTTPQYARAFRQRNKQCGTQPRPKQRSHAAQNRHQHDLHRERQIEHRIGIDKTNIHGEKATPYRSEENTHELQSRQ